MTERHEQPPSNGGPGRQPEHIHVDRDVLLDALRGAGASGLENLAGSDPQLLRELQRTLPVVGGHFARLVERTPSAVAEIAPDGTILYANRGLSDLSGYTPEDLAGGNWQELFFPSEKIECGREFLDRCREGDVRDFEITITAKSGRNVILSLFTANEYRADGELVRIVTCGINVTDRKEAQEALRRNAHDLDAAQRMAHVGSWSGRLDSEELQLSDECYRLLGYQPREVAVTRTFLINAVHPADRDAVREARVSALSSGKLVALDFRIVRPDGQLRLLRCWFELEYDAQGNPVRELATALDITEQREVERVLQYNQSVLAEAQRVAHVGSFVQDLESGRIIPSDEASRLFGYEPGEIQPDMQLFLSWVHPDDRPKVREALENAGQKDILPSVEYRATRKDGEERILVGRGAVQPMPDGTRKLIGTVQDITEQKRAEEALRYSRGVLAEAQRIAQVGDWVLDLASGEIVPSEEAYRIMGLHPGDVEPRLEVFLTMVHAEDRDRVRKTLDYAVAHRSQVTTVECRIERPNGEERIVQLRGAVEFDRGQPRALGTIQDITGPKRAEQALRESEQRFRLLAERIEDVFWIASPNNGRLVYLSPAFERIWGRPRESLTATPTAFLEWVHPEDRARITETFETHLQRSEQVSSWWDEEYRIIQPDGETRWIRDRSFPVFNEAGELELLAGISTDVTAKKKAEASIRESEERFRLIAETVEDFFWIGAPDNSAMYYASPAYERIFGRSLESLYNNPTSFLDAIHPEDRPAMQALADAHTRQLPEARRDWDREYRIVRPDGTPAWVRDRGFPVLDGAGGVRFITGIVTDITDRKQGEEALRASEERYRVLVEQAADGIAVCDPDSLCVAMNSATCKLLGYPEQEFRPNACEFTVPEDSARFKEMHTFLINHPDQVHRGEWLLRRKSGDRIPVEISAKVFPNGRLQAFIRDISARKQAEEKLRQAATVFENTTEAILIADSTGRVVSVNRAFVDLTGYTPGEVVGQDLWTLESGVHEPDFYREMEETLQRDGHWQGEIWKRRKSGMLFPAWESLSLIRDEQGRTSSIICVFADTSATKQAEERINRLSHYDPLTGIPNRLLFAARLDNALERAKRSQRRIAVLYLDLDRFKFINDTLGHTYGDRLLQIVAERLKGCVRAGDTVARLGGDEFGITLDEIKHPEDAALLASKVMARIAEPALVDGQELQTSASVGISIYPNDGQDRESLAKAADAALYQAKERGRNTYWFYTYELTRRASEFLSLERRLRRALNRGEFVLYYQPEVDVATGRIVGVEALLRWLHPEKGLQLPDSFLALAEETHLIDRIGDWVLEEACGQARRWIAAGFGPQRLAVNLSGSQLLYGRLLETIREVLQQFRLVPPELNLELEVTENILQSAQGTVERLRELKSLGLNLAIDDFGTGYSALSSLKFLPVDRLKIDKSFLHDVEINSSDRAIATAIVQIGHSLGLTVIAEGVETEGQLNFLKSIGCDEAQGHLFSPPSPGADMARLLQRDRGQDKRV